MGSQGATSAGWHMRLSNLNICASFRPGSQRLLGFQPGCWGFGGEDKDTALESGVGRGPHLWATSAAGTSPQGLTCIRGAWESALLLHRQVAEGRRNGPCGGSGNVLGSNIGLAEGKWGIRDKGLYL